MASSIAELLPEVNQTLGMDQYPKPECTTAEPAPDSVSMVQSEQVSRTFGNLMLDPTYNSLATHHSCSPRRSASDASQFIDFSALKTANTEQPPKDGNPPTSASRGNVRNDKMEEMVAEAAVNMINAMTKIMNSNQRRRSQQADDANEMSDQHAGLSDRKREVLQKILSTALDQLSGHPEKANGPASQVGGTSKKEWIQCEFCSKRTRLRCEMK